MDVRATLVTSSGISCHVHKISCWGTRAACIVADRSTARIVLRPHDPSTVKIHRPNKGVFGDSPFRAKLAEWLTCGAYLGCGCCNFSGWWLANGVCLRGVSEDVEQKKVGNGQRKHGRYNEYKLSHTDHIARCTCAHIGQKAPFQYWMPEPFYFCKTFLP
eukprot:355677-Chlamydomonas_euryale.AAC.2